MAIAMRLRRVWEVATGRELATLKHESNPLNQAFTSPALEGDERLYPKRLTNRVWSVAWSRDGQKLVTGSGDSTAKLWDAASGRELLTLKGHSAIILSAVFSPDGQRILTGSEDQTARFWEAATPEQVAAWAREEGSGR